MSDYARFQILYTYGGLYFDTDVELIKPLEDLIEKGGFMGFETEDTIAPGLGLGTEAGNPIYKEMVELYNSIHFRNANGTLNLTTIVSYTTEVLKKRGLKPGNTVQYMNGIYLYPKEYFNPIDHNSGQLCATENTRAIHHYMASWCSPASRKRGKIYQLLYSYFGENIANSIRSMWHGIQNFIVKK